ncbi:3-phosphoshikimate 1-carboxyvinyltransferase [Inconstantimicrobium mannanitabidum]|uniref:3-phosphoshikimate 1-carboxyvinyltransferase n=1 Tax=Inconstantimicrobium mannanitabidum TaxID=1604901 RepID=A0ACB5R8B5_9CLOT|nr:3-phosphoshikimate 1-carboxyvinyltransferase [Clostridium sp. TW13]GKX65423.1 3-phosphoshikimate 1-carboxyvinyltransferase [Clostridium sp. TW13]
MKEISISPKKLSGDVNIPPSKSMAHRAVICASLSNGKSIITNIDYSDDIIATINAMRALGADIIEEERKLIIDGTNIFEKDAGIIDCNESGSTLRFLVPLSIARKNKVKFLGRGNLGKRPLTTFYNIFDKQEIKYSYKEDVLDLCIEGELKGGEYKVEGNISSQFITGLLFTLPVLKEDSIIEITTELESKGYIDLTLDMLNKFGIKIINNDYKQFVIKGNQEYTPMNYRVEGDYSQGAFYLCADALGNKVKIKDLDLNSLQGDKEIIDILESLGAKVLKAEEIEVQGWELVGTVIDGAQCPDVIPITAVVCALSKGKSRIINAKRLRIKECDRLKAISTELNKLGANIIEEEDGLIIEGVDTLTGGKVHSWKDHRIAMSLAIAATCCVEKVTIDYAECVSKSYPNFWQDYERLGGNIDERILGE